MSNDRSRPREFPRFVSLLVWVVALGLFFYAHSRMSSGRDL